MIEAGLQGKDFSVGSARAIVRDLFRPNPAIYWTDFLVSWSVGLFLFWLSPRVLGVEAVRPWGGLLSALAFVGCAVLFYRCATFTHELVHLRGAGMRAFSLVWNLLCGIPFLLPSFTYHTHVQHHYRKLYATKMDGEYLFLAGGPRWKIVAYLAEAALFPLLAIIRFALLTPLGWLSPVIRRWIYLHMSSMVIDPVFVRPIPTAREIWLWRIQEGATFAYVWAVAVEWWLGILPWHFLPRAYAIGVTVMFLNAVRTLGAHRYRIPRHEVSFLDQLMDSINYPRSLWTGELWAPVGMRYHALHHLFPSLPYHNLGVAHQRLMEQLPGDSPYRRTESPSLWTSLRQLWKEAGEGRAVDWRAWDASEARPAHPLRATALAAADRGGSRPHVGS